MTDYRIPLVIAVGRARNLHHTTPQEREEARLALDDAIKSKIDHGYDSDELRALRALLD